MKYLLLILLSFSSIGLLAQEKKKEKKVYKDSTKYVKRAKPLSKVPIRKAQDTITLSAIDYKIITFERDTTYLDTTLTIEKEYKYNYLRQDNFELMSFSNIGQAYNNLAINFDRVNMYPSLGATAKDLRYFEKEQVVYYNVPTPMTELFFKTTLEQGQLLDANLTFNTSKRLNFSLGYTGHRSLGKYNSDQIQSGNFITTANYLTKNGRYALRAHIAAQNIDAQENGGLTDKELQFESGDEDFINRPRVDVRFDDIDNKILGKRYYLDHTYKLVRKRLDSTSLEKTSLSIGHSFDYETKYYSFRQANNDQFFGEAILATVNDLAYLKTFYNQVNVQFYNRTLGKLSGNVNVYNYNYYFNSRLIEENGNIIQNQLKGAEIALGGAYDKRIGGFDFKASLNINVSGDLTGNILDASAAYKFKNNNKLRFSIHSSERLPNFNYLLYQSEYLNYNWQNVDSFQKERVSRLGAQFSSKRWGVLSTDFTNVDNYSYFAPVYSVGVQGGFENANIKPLQESTGLSYLKVKYEKEFKVGKFALNNTIMYQNVGQENQVLNVPDLITRNTLYFSSDVFNKAMFLQTGITLKYFTAYNMDGYNPVLGEFYLQNEEELGGFPMLDFFINARIQQTRVYLKLEHFNSSFTGYNFYAAPDYPYRDAVIRFGLVWNFFS